MKNKSLFIMLVACVSFAILCSCSSNQNRSYELTEEESSSSEETTETDLSSCYSKIEKLSKKIVEEGEAFYPKTNFKVECDGEYLDAGTLCLNACTALTNAANHDTYVNINLGGVKQGENVTHNLQEIDYLSNILEDLCTKGCDELNEKDCIDSSLRESWMAVLKRISQYSAEIREQVQILRDAQ